MKHFPRYVPLTALSLATVALITACGGGGSSTAAGPVTLAGAVIDGYIVGATVCLDLNSNGACDSGEPSATSGANGAYTLTVAAGTDLTNLHILANVPATGATDDGVPITNAYRMLTPASMPGVLSPLTTVVSTQMKVNGKSVATARIDARTDLALPGYDFLKDHIAATDADALKARNVAKVMAAVLANSVGATPPTNTTLGAALTTIRANASSINDSTVAGLVTSLGPVGGPGPAPAPAPTPTPAACGTTDPTCAPTTSIPSGSLTVYSETISTAALDAFPNWGQSTQYVEANIASNKSLKYTNLNYQGIVFDPVNVAAKAKIHIDFWTPAAGDVKVSVIAAPGPENAVTKTLVAGSWNSIEIDLSQYSVDLTKINQIKLEGTGTLYVDNIYFTGTAATPAPAPAPAPTPSPSGAVTFSSGFSSNVLTLDNGAIASGGGSNLDGYNCNGQPAWCGSGADAAGSVGADSSMYFYYQTPSIASGLYSQIEVFGPGITGLSASADTGGVNIASKTNVKFNFNPNPEWFQTTAPKLGVVLTLGKRYAIGAGCHIELHGVKPIASGGNTAYSMVLSSDFRVAQDCGTGIAQTNVAGALAASPVVSSVKFVGAGGPAAILGTGSVNSTANLSVVTGGVYPTTVALKGAISFD